MHLFRSALLLATIGSFLTIQNATGESLQLASSLDATPVELWNYEPRVWFAEDVAPSDDFPSSGSSGGEEGVSYAPGSNLFKFNETLEETFLDVPVRRRGYFLAPDALTRPIKTPRPARKRASGGFSLRQNSNNDECTQFRVDTREAIICDKRRCDKLDFEWPKYPNQLTIIQTTRDGMRFHRQDLAFASSASRSSSNQLSEADRIKFDLLDLFKPKPTQAPEPSTPASTMASTTPAPKTTVPVADTETSSGTTGATTATQATIPGGSNPPLAPTRRPPGGRDTPITDTDILAQDSNTTRFVTTFRLDTTRRMQQMIGFGGALSDSTCRNIKSLSTEMARSLMEDYFGERGLRYNIARLSMGSSDFSTTPYTNNDALEPKQSTRFQASGGADDVEMNNFRLVGEDYEFKLPLVRQAKAVSRQEIKFFASMWSPPIWMKNNSHIVHGYLKGDIYGPYYKGLAELMIRWLEAYRRQGVNFWATTALNEPITGVKPFIFHNSLGITRDDYVTFYKLYLGPMMKQRGFGSMKLIMHDDNKGYAPNWVRAMMRDPEAAKYVDGIGFHWYMNDEFENMDFIRREYPNKFIISTEACNGFLPFQVHALPGNWDRGVAYMYDIIKVIQKGSSGWVDWNMALDLTGGPTWAKNFLDAAIIVNARLDEYYKSPMFYAMGQFSRFVEPNSTRLDHRLSNAQFDYPLEAVGFMTPKNYVVIVALNANKHPVPFKIIVDRKLVREVTLRAESFSTIVFKWNSPV